VTEDEAFIRAVVDSPGDDTPRLVLRCLTTRDADDPEDDVMSSPDTVETSVPAYLIGLTALIQVQAISLLVWAIDGATDPMDKDGAGANLAFVKSLFALFMEAICVGLWLRASIAWTAGVVYYGLALVGVVIGLLLTSQTSLFLLLSVPFDLVILALLFTPSVRGRFAPQVSRPDRQPRPAPVSSPPVSHPPREIAGRTCALCGSQINDESGAGFCHWCGEPSHMGCRKPAGIHDPGCPGCGRQAEA
jgi:hypothetical protein